ncbi:MAG TPA: hypothetical protein VK928_11880, partial [Longimicrobiales bacterium]|nr:hypothetical protein [Longimicrobiales bacterium]
MTTYRVLLPHPLEPRLLMMRAHGELRLPEWDDATEHPWQMADHVNRAVSARVGIETTVLRCVDEVPEPGEGRVVRTYEMDNHSAPHDMAPATLWVGAAELGAIGTVEDATRDVV